MRSRSKVASTARFGRAYSTDTLPSAAVRAACAASSATAPRSWRPTSKARVFVAAGQDQEGFDQVLHPPRGHADGTRPTFRPLRVLIDGPLVEHSGVAADGGQGGSQLVAGVGGETPLARERFLAPGEGRLQAGQKGV